MKHAVIADKPENGSGKYVEAELTDNCKIYLAETEYTQKELEEFCSLENDWILRLDGRKCFLARSDSGEDADGQYSAWFDLMAEKAVFDNGTCVGIYLCPDSIRYSGNDRSSFEIDDWGYPGYDPFTARWASESHVFLFSDEGTHKWRAWTLLKRKYKAACEPYLHF